MIYDIGWLMGCDGGVKGEKYPVQGRQGGRLQRLEPRVRSGVSPARTARREHPSRCNSVHAFYTFRLQAYRGVSKMP
nr:uncharacterized protein CTRU02_00039 [Colletotrichum truncatum]KAF6801290.1 hypothetical protein CTRU02_00039 [Colletotrichum truncatum]